MGTEARAVSAIRATSSPGASNIHGNNVHLWAVSSRRPDAKARKLVVHRSPTKTRHQQPLPTGICRSIPAPTPALALAMMHVHHQRKIFTTPTTFHGTRLVLRNCGPRFRSIRLSAPSGGPESPPTTIRKLAREIRHNPPRGHSSELRSPALRSGVEWPPARFAMAAVPHGVVERGRVAAFRCRSAESFRSR